MARNSEPGARPGKGLARLAIVFAVVSAVLLLVFSTSRWYAGNVSLPRYCDDPEGHLARVKRILTERTPVGEAKMRPYIIAAKLIFLVPRRDGETVEAYLRRLREEIRKNCA